MRELRLSHDKRAKEVAALTRPTMRSLRQRRMHKQWLEQQRAEQDQLRCEELQRQEETKRRERVEHRASLPAQWANEVERELEADRKLARLR
jgi:hypothetical protein